MFNAAFASPNNGLLTALPAEEYQQLLPHLESVPLEMGQVLCEPNAPIHAVYFPKRGLVSLVAILQSHAAEVAIVGNEGMVGLSVFLDIDRACGWGRAIVQVPGEALRMDRGVFKQELQSSDTTLYRLLQRYTQSRINQMAQMALCNHVHSIRQRCCRCLLMVQDRMQSDQLPLTQEILAQMLGVRRAGVSEVASAIQRQGLIQYHRGQITILSRSGLEAAACQCYALIEQEFTQLLQ